MAVRLPHHAQPCCDVNRTDVLLIHPTLQEELERLQRSEAAARAEAEAATTRATAAEARVASLEREADGLARDVATLQVEGLGRPLDRGSMCVCKDGVPHLEDVHIACSTTTGSSL